MHTMISRLMLTLFGMALLSSFAPRAAGSASDSVQHPRARDLGVPFDGTPGPLNAITDVDGVLVGHTTLISGSGKLVVGKGPVRTGVTADSAARTLPRCRISSFAGWYAQNGNGEMTGTTWVEESGFLEGPMLITNTHSVGVVRDAVIAWRIAHGKADATGSWWSLPVVAETWDGWLNDINGFHVKPEHVFHALDTARIRPGDGRLRRRRHRHDLQRVQGRYRHRVAQARRRGWRLHRRRAGAMQLRQARPNLRIAGVPVGREIESDAGPLRVDAVRSRRAWLDHRRRRDRRAAPAASAQAHRAHACRSASDETAASPVTAPATSSLRSRRRTPARAVPTPSRSSEMVPNDSLDPLFAATVQATEEAIVNAMVGAEDMTGIDGHRVRALPHDKLRAVLGHYNLLTH